MAFIARPKMQLPISDAVAPWDTHRLPLAYSCHDGPLIYKETKPADTAIRVTPRGLRPAACHRFSHTQWVERTGRLAAPDSFGLRLKGAGDAQTRLLTGRSLADRPISIGERVHRVDEVGTRWHTCWSADESSTARFQRSCNRQAVCPGIILPARCTATELSHMVSPNNLQRVQIGTS